jgi:hypothetical protein
MKMHEIVVWTEAHPVEATVIGAGGLIAFLWLFGFFGSGKSANSGASNLAAAFYAAEAQQAVVGGQIQQTTLLTAADTAKTKIQADAAVAINSANTTAATTINGQNATAATTINTSLSHDALLRTYSNNSTATAINKSNNETAATIADSNNKASVWQTIMGVLMPAELAYGGGYGAVNAGPYGGARTYVPGAAPSISGLIAAGYTPDQAAKVASKQLGYSF